MKKSIRSLLSLFVLLILPALTFAQERQMMRFDAGTSMMLKEFSALLIEEAGNVTVRMRLGNNDEKTEGDQLESGDHILMMNAKRTSSIADLRETYENIKTGEEVKIGVQRGEQRFILNALKGDYEESDSEGGMRMTMNFESEDGPAPTLIPELGLVLTDNQNKIEVLEIMDMMLPKELADLSIKGYTLTEISDKKPATAKEAQNLVQKIKTGEKLSITFEKDGDVKKVSLKKPEAKGRIMISNDDNE